MHEADPPGVLLTKLARDYVRYIENNVKKTNRRGRKRARESESGATRSTNISFGIID